MGFLTIHLGYLTKNFKLGLSKDRNLKMLKKFIKQNKSYELEK